VGGKRLLECKWQARGDPILPRKRGCEAGDGKVHCDESLASRATRVKPPRACAVDGSALLKCVKGKLAVAKSANARSTQRSALRPLGNGAPRGGDDRTAHGPLAVVVSTSTARWSVATHHRFLAPLLPAAAATAAPDRGRAALAVLLRLRSAGGKLDAAVGDDGRSSTRRFVLTATNLRKSHAARLRQRCVFAELSQHLRDGSHVVIADGHHATLVRGLLSARQLGRLPIVGSRLRRQWGGLVVATHCVGRVKVVELRRKLASSPGRTFTPTASQIVRCCAARVTSPWCRRATARCAHARLIGSGRRCVCCAQQWSRPKTRAIIRNGKR